MLFSLIDKRCCEVANPSLFGQINFGKQLARELEKPYNDLFDCTNAKILKRLSSHHLSKVKIEMLEDTYDSIPKGQISEYEVRHQVLLKCLERIRSTGTVELKLTL